MSGQDADTADFGIITLPTVLPMTPTQALTTGFDIAQSALRPGKPDKVSLRVGGESRQGFRIGELRFMIGYEDGSELSEVPAIHRLPNAPDWFCGIANLHGKFIPVFDLAAYMDVDPDLEAKRMLLVLLHGHDATGVLIDGQPERLHRIDDEPTDAVAAPERLMPHLRGIRQIGERLWFDLDPRSLLAAIEKSLAMQQ